MSTLRLTELSLLLPELELILLLISLLIVGMLAKSVLHYTYFLGFCHIIWVLATDSNPDYNPSNAVSLFDKHLGLDKTTHVFRWLWAVGGLGIYFLLQHSKKLQALNRPLELYLLVTGMWTGLAFMVVSRHTMMLFLSLEIVSICAYILVHICKEKISAEASMKYLLYGIFSSALFLMGLTWQFGLSGSFSITDVDASILFSSNQGIWVALTGIFLLAGITFKLAAFPFHFWVADVYQAAPYPIVALLAFTAKLSGVVLLYNTYLFWEPVSISHSQQFIFSLFTLLFFTFLVGNAGALRQYNFKRLYAYASIAQSGFVLLPFLSGEIPSMDLIGFYLLYYSVVNYAILFIAEYADELTGSSDLHNWFGFGRMYKILGLFFVLSIVAIAGLPPTFGFWAKFQLFIDAWNNFTNLENPVILIGLLWCIINTAIALVYLIKVPYFILFKSTAVEIKAVQLNPARLFIIGVFGVALVLFFIFPQWIPSLIQF